MTNQAETYDHGDPKTDIVQCLVASYEPCPLEHDNGKLQHLADEAVASNLFGYAGHDDFVHDGRDEEGDDCGDHFARVRPRRRVDVSAEERVHGDVPLAGEFHPVCRVPPVCVEVAVAEAGDFGEGAEDVFEDDEEDEEEGEHEGEQEPGDGLGEDEERFGDGRIGEGAEAALCVDEDGEDEFLGHNG